MKSTGSMTFIDAATKVLSDTPSGGPLHFRDICEQAIEKGYLKPTGKTPWQSMGAQLYMVIKSDEAAGRQPRFVQAGKGLFALSRRKPVDRIEGLIEEAHQKVRCQLLEALKATPPRRFEELIGELLTLIGFEDVEITGRSGDKGIDAIGRLTVGGITNVSTAIQAKRWKGTVDPKVIREMRGSLQVGQRGTIITTAQFTKPAIEEASADGKEPISLIDGEKLLDLMFQNELAVKKRPKYLFELKLEDLEGDPIEEIEGIDVTLPDGGTDKSDLRVAGLFPLPGGTDDYLDILLRILRQVGVEGATRDEMIKWFFTEFPSVRSNRTVLHTLQTLRTAGFLCYDGELLKPSDAALQLLRKPSGNTAVQILSANVLGVSEMLEWLGEQPLSKQHIYERLCQQFSHLRWTTDTQVRIRLTWLDKLGAVTRVGGTYRVRD